LCGNVDVLLSTNRGGDGPSSFVNTNSPHDGTSLFRADRNKFSMHRCSRTVIINDVILCSFLDIKDLNERHSSLLLASFFLFYTTQLPVHSH